MKNDARNIRKVYSLLLENAYGSSLTNKKMWLDIFDKIGKSVDEEKVFQKSERDFGAVTEAENYVESLGMSIGSMQSDNPRALAKGKLNIAKWWNIDKDDYQRIDGLMLSDDYRNGSVVVVTFKGKGELGDVVKAPEDEGEAKPEGTEEEPSVTPPPAENNQEQVDQQPSPTKELKMPESFEDKVGRYAKILNENKK